MEMIESCVPPGFRFHPTEEELVGYYLKRKISSLKIDLNVIVEIDLYRIEPWDIQGRCNLGYEEQNEWYFFSYKDRKYPSGTRTNRATGAGFWKATGRDKAVVSKDKIIGMRKTLVYYKGRAPNGRKSDWIMHEYRLQTTDLINGPPPQEEGWVVCRAFKKPSPSHHKQSYEPWNNNMTTYNNSCLRLDNTTHYNPPSFPASTNNFELLNQSTNHDHQRPQFLQDQPLSSMIHHSPFDQSRQMMMELPSLDSPSISTSFTTHENNFEQANEDLEDHHDEIKIRSNSGNQYNIDWKRFEDHTEPSSYAYPNVAFVSNSDHHDLAQTHISHILECFPEL